MRGEGAENAKETATEKKREGGRGRVGERKGVRESVCVCVCLVCVLLGLCIL